MATKDAITHTGEYTDTAVAHAIGATFVHVDVKKRDMPIVTHCDMESP